MDTVTFKDPRGRAEEREKTKNDKKYLLLLKFLSIRSFFIGIIDFFGIFLLETVDLSSRVMI